LIPENVACEGVEVVESITMNGEEAV